MGVIFFKKQNNRCEREQRGSDKGEVFRAGYKCNPTSLGGVKGKVAFKSEEEQSKDCSDLPDYREAIVALSLRLKKRPRTNKIVYREQAQVRQINQIPAAIAKPRQANHY